MRQKTHFQYEGRNVRIGSQRHTKINIWVNKISRRAARHDAKKLVLKNKRALDGLIEWWGA